MNVLHAFLEGIEILPIRVYFIECCRMCFLENFKAYFAPFLTRAYLTFLLGKTRKKTIRKKKALTHNVPASRPELGTFFVDQ
jgi:hypothetical protein